MEPAPDGHPVATTLQQKERLFSVLGKVVLVGEVLVWNESEAHHVPIINFVDCVNIGGFLQFSRNPWPQTVTEAKVSVSGEPVRDGM